MRTTATNRKLRVLITAIRDKKLIPRPEFQRRLVWLNKHKVALIETVLAGYPFPEIYVAAGDVDPVTAEGTEMLVDGQQRITTLFQYFTGSEELSLGGKVLRYAELPEDQKTQFLEYEVVIRDLGKMTIEEMKEVFKRINSTQYSLNAMELHNARYDGEFKLYGQALAEDVFFDEHRVFSQNEIRRMQDIKFALTFVVSIMSAYFHRDSELEEYLRRYNDEFNEKTRLDREVRQVFDFIGKCKLEPSSRVWKTTDLLTLLVEIHRALFRSKLDIKPEFVGPNLRKFYNKVDSIASDKDNTMQETDPKFKNYHLASAQATNDRGSRVTRGEIVRGILETDKGSLFS